MKRVAIFGSNGQLGKTLQSASKNEKDNYSFFTKDDVDVTNKKSLESTLNNLNFDFCINCSAYTNVEAAETNINDAFSINAEGVKNISEVCKFNNIKLVHISTDYVFDGKKNSPYRTSDNTHPINQYGKSKLKGEVYIQEILNEYYIIRTSWLYSVYGNNFVNTIINKLRQDLKLNITTEEQGTPTSCIELSKFIFHVIRETTIPHGIYNFSAQGYTTWYGFSKEIAKHFNPKREANILPSDSFATIADRPKYSVLDNSKTEKIYKPLDSWQKSVEEVVNKLTL